jgi:hypothetical protein
MFDNHPDSLSMVKKTRFCALKGHCVGFAKNRVHGT